MKYFLPLIAITVIACNDNHQSKAVVAINKPTVEEVRAKNKRKIDSTFLYDYSRHVLNWKQYSADAGFLEDGFTGANNFTGAWDGVDFGLTSNDTMLNRKAKWLQDTLPYIQLVELPLYRKAFAHNFKNIINTGYGIVNGSVGGKGNKVLKLKGLDIVNSVQADAILGLIDNQIKNLRFTEIIILNSEGELLHETYQNIPDDSRYR